MARGKKKETLTPEERLQAALVLDKNGKYSTMGIGRDAFKKNT